MGVPGTGDMYGLVIDAFQHPNGVQHPTASDNWLKVVGSKAGSDAFNPLKGSISKLQLYLSKLKIASSPLYLRSMGRFIFRTHSGFVWW